MVNIVRKILIVSFVMGLNSAVGLKASSIQEPVDYVNPYMGQIQHAIVGCTSLPDNDKALWFHCHNQN